MGTEAMVSLLSLLIVDHLGDMQGVSLVIIVFFFLRERLWDVEEGHVCLSSLCEGTFLREEEGIKHRG